MGSVSWNLLSKPHHDKRCIFMFRNLTSPITSINPAKSYLSTHWHLIIFHSIPQHQPFPTQLHPTPDLSIPQRLPANAAPTATPH